MNISSVDSFRCSIDKVDMFFTETTKDGLAVLIDTDKVHIRSTEATDADLEFYSKSAEIQNRIRNVWAKRWREKDPYSALAVFKSIDYTFLGHVVLEKGSIPGEYELTYLFDQRESNKKYEEEALTVIIQEYIPTAASEGYNSEGVSLRRITTTGSSNAASLQLFNKLGMQKLKEESPLSLKSHFYLDIKS
jgi:hypothetical protein